MGKSLKIIAFCGALCISGLDSFSGGQSSKESIISAMGLAHANPVPVSMFEVLFDRYLHGLRVNAAAAQGATLLIAEEGDWRRVLGKLREREPHFEVPAVRILGLIAENQASYCDNLEAHIRGEYRGPQAMPAGRQTGCLPSQIVPELLERGQPDSNSNFEHYVIALAKARDVRTKNLFLGVLNAPDNRYAPSVQFHAAAGLANLQDPAGVEWLIENSGNRNHSVWHAWPSGACCRRLHACCDRALAQLSGHFEDCDVFRGVEYWRKWWEESECTIRKDRRVYLAFY